MNVYSFERLEILSTEDIVEKTNILMSYRYSGMMLPYGQFMGDYLTKVARAIDDTQDFKYMIAIRPHAISPQYLSMILHSISSISKNRILINFVSGNIQEYEKKYGGIIQKPDDFSSNTERKHYLVDYIKEFSNITKNKDYRPKIMVSGFSNEVSNVVNNYADCIIMNYKMFIDNRSAFDSVIKRKMMAFSPVIRNSREELELFKNSLISPPNDIFYFTPEEFKSFLSNLESNGVTDILISYVLEDNLYKNIYEAVSNYLK